jgi:dCMP deaminase
MSVRAGVFSPHPEDIMESSNKWDARFLRLAQVVSSWSKDPSTKVGAAIVRDDHTLVSVGYNGFPRGCDDDVALYEDRPTKYMRIVHAEVNAILTAREPVAGCTLYVWPLQPCAACTGVIIQSGIKRVVAYMKDEPGQWANQFNVARKMCEEAGIKVTMVQTLGDA